MRKKTGPRTDPSGNPVKIYFFWGHIIFYKWQSHRKQISFLEVRAEPFIDSAPYGLYAIVPSHVFLVA